MLKTKSLNRVVLVTTALMLVAALLLWGQVEAVQGDGSHEVGYENLLFDQSRVHTIDITMANWDELIETATSETYMECSITIDGEKFNNVAIRAKGNTSLSSVATMGSSRYSFKVEFDHYVKGMTYHSLDKLSLNNLIQDATMMKDYLAYTLMNRMGVPTPLCSFVQINVNGEPWGLYLAVEGVEEGFLDRNGMSKGDLYKPDSLSFGGGRGNGKEFSFDQFNQSNQSNQTDENSATKFYGQNDQPSEPNATDATDATNQSGENNNAPSSDFAPSSGAPANLPSDFAPSSGNRAQDGQNPPNFPNTGDANATGDAPSGDAPSGDAPSREQRQSFAAPGFGGGMGSDDVKLIYSDDNPDSYSNIFDSAKTKVTKKDKARLIESLRKLNAQEDIESVVDTDEVIRYLVVHNFLCNDDSYTGSMVHNYYLYEEQGQLSIIPWDYNLSFGGFSASQDATSTVNSPIDSPVSGGDVSNRPLVAWIFADEEALSAYHTMYSQFIAENIENGWLSQEISRVQEMITPYLEQDTTKFYTMEEFEKAVETLQTFCEKRGESIRGQLDGTIPATTQGQQNSDALIDASEIATTDMGSMNRGDQGGAPGGFTPPSNFTMPTNFTPPNGDNQGTAPTNFTQPNGDNQGTEPTNFTQPNGDNQGTAPTNFTPPDNFTSPDNGQEKGTSDGASFGGSRGTQAQESTTPEASENAPTAAIPDAPDSNRTPPEGAPNGSGAQGNQWLLLALYGAVLLAGILIVCRVRAHNE